jgi:hypothetical protein
MLYCNKICLTLIFTVYWYYIFLTDYGPDMYHTVDVCQGLWFSWQISTASEQYFPVFMSQAWWVTHLSGHLTALALCQTRTAGVVNVVYVNIVTWSVGCERVGEIARGGAVVSRPGTRVDGYSPPWEKKLVLQVSKRGLVGSKRLGWMGHRLSCKYCNI